MPQIRQNSKFIVKKSQGSRARASEKFRESKDNIVTFTADVSERGVDYPDVTHVIQFGIPEGRESYIHRVGRTGRIGKVGASWLILFHFESPFLQELQGLDIRRGLVLQDPASFEEEEALYFPSSELSGLLSRIRSGDLTFTPMAKLAYQAFLGYHATDKNLRRIKLNSKQEAVHMAGEFLSQIGLSSPPALGADVMSKIGLHGLVEI